MKSTFDYVLYRANGEKVVIARGVARKEWDEIKSILNADMLEIVNKDYIDPTLDDEIEKVRCTYYMDEEARLKGTTNVRNPFFKVIRIGQKGQQERQKAFDPFGFEYVVVGVPKRNGVEEWDIVGDVVMEKKNK